MNYNLEIHHRHSQRLHGYDYTLAGAYFVTICTQGREPLFGKMVLQTKTDSKLSQPSQLADCLTPQMELNAFGKIVQFTWSDLENHNTSIVLDAFIIMPHHVHGIIGIKNAETAGIDLAAQDNEIDRVACPPVQNPIEQRVQSRITLSEIVRQFKTFSARRINILRNTPGNKVWQRNYYDHIIRDEADLFRVYAYIENNPARWALEPVDW